MNSNFASNDTAEPSPVPRDILENEFVKRILHSSPACFLVETDGLVSYVTPFTESFLGISVGHRLSDYYNNPAEVEDIVPTASTSNYHNWITVIFKTPYGDIKEMEIAKYIAPYDGKDNVLVWFNDVSKVNQAENALRYARGQAVDSVRSGHDVLAKISFEAHGMVSIVQGLTDLVLLSDTNDATRASLNKVLTTLSGFMSNIDSLTSSQAVSDDPSKTNFKLGDVFQYVETAIKQRVGKRKLTYELFLQPDLPETLIGQQQYIQQVLVNLIKNAIGFTREGGINVKVAEYDRYESTITLLFSVQDTGCGMPEEQVSALFSQFANQDEESANRYKNGGLGLTTCKTLIETMGGMMWCDSTVGVGTSIFFTANCELPPYTSNAEDFEQVPEAEGRDPSKVNVLIVDDNKINQTVAYELLRRKGYQAVVADSGNEAIDIINSGQVFNLIFMDIYMPDMDGLTATKIIKEILPDVPIIALTACAMPGDKEMCLAMGMNDYFTKPFESSLFINLVKRWTN